MVEEKKDSDHLDASLKRHAKDVKDMNAYMDGNDKESPIRPEQVTTAVNKYAAPDAVFTVDTGTPCIWSARFLCSTLGRKTLASFNHGSMANAMPMAIGAQKAYPNRQVVALCGDGGLSMLLGDLITIAQYKLPVKLMVYNNDCLDFIQLEMQAAGLIPWGINLDNPSFAAVADAVGIKGFVLDKSSQVDEMVQAFLKYPGGSAGCPCGPGCHRAAPLHQPGAGRGLLPGDGQADADRGSEAGVEHPGREPKAVQALRA